MGVNATTALPLTLALFQFTRSCLLWGRHFMCYRFNTFIGNFEERSGPQDRRMQIRVESDLESRPPLECQMDGTFYLDKIERWVSSFDFVFAFSNLGILRSTGLSFDNLPGEAHEGFSMENRRGFGNPCYRLGIGFEPKPFIRVKVVESYTVQRCDTDKTRSVPYANKLAPESTPTRHVIDYLRGVGSILINSTSNVRVALAGMTGGNPRAP